MRGQGSESSPVISPNNSSRLISSILFAPSGLILIATSRSLDEFALRFRRHLSRRGSWLRIIQGRARFGVGEWVTSLRSKRNGGRRRFQLARHGLCPLHTRHSLCPLHKGYRSDKSNRLAGRYEPTRII